MDEVDSFFNYRNQIGVAVKWGEINAKYALDTLDSGVL